MANAKLHIICGNCGCNDHFKFKIDLKGHDITNDKTEFKPAVFITCNNCATIHDLSSTITEHITHRSAASQYDRKEAEVR